MTNEDLWADAEVIDWMNHVRTEMVPKLKESAMSMVIAPGNDPDIKVAVELGYSLLLGKPLLICVFEDRPVPDALRRAADAVVEMTGDGVRDREKLQAAMDLMMEDR